MLSQIVKSEECKTDKFETSPGINRTINIKALKVELAALHDTLTKLEERLTIVEDGYRK